MGRFTSPDPENLGSILSDPQSWNAYAYGRNNPLKFTDPFGLNYTVCDANNDNCADLTDKQYAQYLQDSKNIVQRSNPDPSTNSLYVNNPNGSSTFLGTATYYNEKDVAAAQQISQQAGPVVNTLAELTLSFIMGPGFSTLGGTGVEIAGLRLAGPHDAYISPSTPVGRRGSPADVEPGTNAGGATIGGRRYTGHALDQMQGRGAVPSVVEDTIRNGTQSPGNLPNTIKHSTSQMDVVTNPNGDVITVIVRGGGRR
jgi:hypothetical protein